MTTATAENTETKPTKPTKPTYAPGSWQETLDKSATLFDRSAKGRAKASALLWTGGQVAIDAWLDDSDRDVHAEVLYADLLDVLGRERKGDASKIKTVALAVKSNGLVLANWANLSKAYAEAKRLTVTVAAQADEDTAADEAVQSIEPPKTASTAEAAAKILLAKGVDEAVRVLLDALNGAATDVQNTPAHRSFLRSVAQEINGRATAEEQAKKDAAAKAKAEADAKKAESKPKPAVKKAAAKKTTAKKAAPAKSKPKPKAAAPVEEPEVEEPVTEPDEDIEDMFSDEPEVDTDDSDVDDLLDGTDEDSADEEPEPVVATKPKVKPRRGPVRR